MEGGFSMRDHKRTITFRKVIKDTGDGEYLTPSTSELYDRIILFCNKHSINVLALIINDPFEISSIIFMGNRKDRYTLLTFLKNLELEFIISDVNTK